MSNLTAIFWSVSCAILLLPNCRSNRNEINEKVILPEMLVETTFPKDSVDDYIPVGYNARIAYPRKEKEGRIWIKGSASYPYCDVDGQKFTLKPPYYTEVVSTSRESVKVQFRNDTSAGKILTLYPYFLEYNEDNKDFSFLIYGCFQPFHVDEKSGKAMVRTDSSLTEYKIREAFRDLAIRDFKSEDTVLSPVSAVINTGDQVYVDAAYYTSYKPNPISAWSVGDRPMPTLSAPGFEEHLDEAYRASNAFNTINEVSYRVPTLAVWDDHEIRDGWGSQGDEYLDSSNNYQKINPRFKPYFMASRRAYLEHQVALGPEPLMKDDTINGNSLHSHAEINGIPIFMMDLRSKRNVLKPIVMADAQMHDFAQWLDELDTGSIVIIVSSVPLFWEAPGTLLRLGKMANEEMEDDIADSWSSQYNKEERNRIYQLLINARIEKNIKPIILSGDIHVGAINEVRFKHEKTSKKAQVLAYEMVASGFAHYNLSEQSWSSQLVHLAGSQGELADNLNRPGTDEEYDINVRMQVSAAKLNFGAFDRTGGKITLKLFVKDQKSFAMFSVPVDWKSGDKVDYSEVSSKNKINEEGSIYIKNDTNITHRNFPFYQ